ncbi:MAG: hypothetical protein AB1611_14955 [bacterium]
MSKGSADLAFSRKSNSGKEHLKDMVNPSHISFSWTDDNPAATFLADGSILPLRKHLCSAHCKGAPSDIPQYQTSSYTTANPGTSPAWHTHDEESGVVPPQSKAAAAAVDELQLGFCKCHSI